MNIDAFISSRRNLIPWIVEQNIKRSGFILFGTKNRSRTIDFARKMKVVFIHGCV